MLETIANLPTLAKVLAHCEAHADMVTIFRDGSFSATFDDTAQDTRLVVRYHAGHSHVTLKLMHGYSAEKHEWTKEGRESRREYPSKRGQLATVKTYKRLAEALKGYFPSILSMYRRPDGAWYAV